MFFKQPTSFKINKYSGQRILKLQLKKKYLVVIWKHKFWDNKVRFLKLLIQTLKVKK